jgi:protein-disulfide isomerase
VWRSPIVLMTVAALLVGLVVVGILVLGSQKGGGTAMRMPPAPLPSGIAQDGRSLGRADAPVSVDVYEDPQCPVCGRWTRDLEPLLVASYVRDGTVRLTYHDYVFIGPESMDAAVGMRAADQLAGKFWPFHDLVFENQGGENAGAFTRDHLATMAGMAGLDKAAFMTKLDDPDLIAAVKASTAAGAALGINSTPTLVVDGVVHTGLPTWAQLSALIDSAAAASPGPSVAPSSGPQASPSPATSPAAASLTASSPAVSAPPAASASATP